MQLRLPQRVQPHFTHDQIPRRPYYQDFGIQNNNFIKKKKQLIKTLYILIIKNDQNRTIVGRSDVMDDVSERDDILQKALKRSGLSEAQDPALLDRVSCTTVVDRASDGAPLQYSVRFKMEGSTRWLLCTNCPKRFKKPLDLVRHLRIHNSIKPFKCQMCHKAFRLKSTLIAHIHSHNGTRDFECSACHKKLASRASLVLHQKYLQRQFKIT